LPPPHPVTVQPREGRFGELFEPFVLPRTVMLVIAWIFQTLGFYGFSAGCRHCSSSADFTLVDSLTWVTAMQLFGLPGR